jgi:glycosyltransferase involved in cell wall biosynthesis
MSAVARTVLWWGRFDPDYSRNRILRQAYAALGWRVFDFHPVLSPLGDVEALLRRPPRADLVHVPCFRQRDIAAAARYARRHGLPLLIDPLISTFDKQVFERGKFPEDSVRARRLLACERGLFRRADAVLADTPEHARFFAETLGVGPSRLHVAYVGAEESLFTPGTPHAPNSPVEVLFYGSFIPLQGPQVIVEAARLYQGPPVRWVLLGSGPLLDECKRMAEGLGNVVFEDWLPYTELPDRIRRADILLGVFGTTRKTQRVIPNKLFQALACGKPVVTCRARAYGGILDASGTAIQWVDAGSADQLAGAVRALATDTSSLTARGLAATKLYRTHFSAAVIVNQLAQAISGLPHEPE